MLGEVLGVERRRRWSEDEKLEILSEVGVRGASVTQVAQRHEITRSQIYGWRRDLKKKGKHPPRVAVRLLDGTVTIASSREAGVALGKASCWASGRERRPATPGDRCRPSSR